MVIVNPFFGAINTGLTGVLNSMGGTSKILLGIVVSWYDGNRYGWSI